MDFKTGLADPSACVLNEYKIVPVIKIIFL